MTRLNRALVASAFLATTLLASPAHALFGDDEARKAIIELRARVAEQDKRDNERIEQVMALNADLMKRLEVAQRAQLDLVNQIDALKQEIARLRGSLDQYGFELANVQKSSRDLYTDLDGRLKNLEPKPVTLDGRSVVIDRDEQAAYDAGMTLFRSSDFAGAIRSFQSFLARYPKSAYAPSAQYWIGSAYYAQKDYKSAIAAQQLVLERFADSPRAPEALLNIAASQNDSNQKAAARVTLQKLIKDYPDSPAAKLARDRLAALAEPTKR